MTVTPAGRWDGQTSLTPKMEKQHATEGQEGGMGGGGHGAEQRLHSEPTQKARRVYSDCLALACRAYDRKSGGGGRPGKPKTW